MAAYDSMLKNITVDSEQVSLESYEDGYTICGSFPSDKIIYIAIPYSDGWTAKLDGADILCMPANNFGMAFYVPAGGHTIKLEYHTPYFK